MNRRHIVAASCVAAGLALAGCEASSHSQAAAHASSAVASLTGNPAYQQDKAHLEARLLANFQKDFTPAHPVTSTQAAVRATFPPGVNLPSIELYAVRTFTPAVATTSGPGSARARWAGNVTTYALGLASIPGFPGTNATPAPAQ